MPRHAVTEQVLAFIIMAFFASVVFGWPIVIAWHVLDREASRSVRVSSAALGETPMPRAQGVRSVRSPLESEPWLFVNGGGRSLPEMADAAAMLCGVPPRLFRDLIARESSWRVDAVSPSGAIGLAQVMPRSARDVSPTLDVRDPWQNLIAGACLLRQYRDRFGSWREALHAYHGGPTRVDQGRTTQQSRNYAQDVMEGSAND